MEQTSDRWHKGAMVVADAPKATGHPDTHIDLYVRRLIRLVQAGALEGKGNLRKPRWSEVRRVDSGFDRGTH